MSVQRRRQNLGAAPAQKGKAQPPGESGKPTITAKNAFPVKHLDHKAARSGGLDGAADIVDNRGPPIAGDVIGGPSPKKISTMPLDLWQQGCERLAAELPEQQFNTWIRPLLPTRPAVPAGAEAPALATPEPAADETPAPEVIAVAVPNRFKLDWIRTQYAGRIESVLSELAGHPVRLELTLAPRSEPTAAASAPLRRADGRADLSVHLHEVLQRSGALRGDGGAGQSATHAFVQGAGEARDRPERGEAAQRTPPPPLHRLNPALTFDTLVAGRANQMARTAALHVAGAPGVTYNPLFIYGGVGLGKTHLMQGVGHTILAARPEARVAYVHSEQFVGDMVRALQHNTINDFKAAYRSLDALLIDDIQFFANKERSQEEFFHTFNALLEEQRQVILTCDRYPKEVNGLEEWLKSRFGWGLTVSIDPPELETSVAILMSKAAAAHKEASAAAWAAWKMMATELEKPIRTVTKPATIGEGFASCCDPDIEATLRERAWTSPIWWEPR